MSRNLKDTVWKEIEQTKDDIVRLCSEIVRIPSENPPGDTREVAAFVRRYLEQQGLTAVEYEPKPKNISLVSTIGESSGRPHLVMNAHLDVFPGEVGETWTTDPFGGEVKNGKIYGRGSGDMKGGLTASLTAFCLLSRFEKSLNGRLTLMLVSDEETGGRWGTEWLLKNHPEFRGDACINGEPSALTVRIGEKGKSFLRLVARGLAGHGSLAQHIGKNAILEMLKAMPIVESMTRIRGRFTREEERLLREVKKGFETYSPGMGSALDHVTVNVGTIKGGVKVNIVPACCEAEVDVRLPLGVTPKWLKIELARRLRSAKLDLKTEFMDMPVVEANYTDPSEKIVKLVVENATSATGEKPMFSFTSGRTDCCYFRERGVPSVVYGPRAFNAAAADEHILIDHLLKVAKVHVGAAIDFLHTA